MGPSDTGPVVERTAGSTGTTRDVDEPGESRSDAVVVCDGVSRVYTRDGGRTGLLGRGGQAPEVEAVSDVTASIGRGEFVGIAGPSGSGKSTLLHLMAALDVPTEGTVRVAGTDTGDCSAAERTRLRRRHVGIVFQRFHLLPSLSAQANVALPLVELGVGTADRRARAERLLEEVGLGDRTGHAPGELSGGEQQRVAIARALATDPDVVVADEPTGELDTDTSDRVLSVLESLDDGTAVVVASHDPRTLERTDRVLRLRDGRRVDR